MTDLVVESQQVIFSEFNKAAESDWARGEILHRQAGKTGESVIRAYRADGSLYYPRIGGFAFGRAIRTLREQFAQKGAGTWLSATIQLTPAGQFNMDVDYDNEPAWKIPVVPETYVEEQELFPRDEEHQPEWYKQKLREAQSK